MDDDEYRILTGISRREFHDIVSSVTSINSTRNRSKRTCIAILLMKLRSALSNKLLAVLFHMTKFQVRRAIVSARTSLMRDFVPHNLGFNHITREEVIQNHTRQLARNLMTEDVTSNPAILVLDGTYIYIQKSSNFAFARRSYSMHKHRPLVKPMMVVTTTGYIVSVLGPYLADSKNNDASILRHMIYHNAEELRNWLQEEDVFVVDRGFRDAQDVLEDVGIKLEMPAFMKRGEKQLLTIDSNLSRVVTKVRWVVEACNGRLKQWQYLSKTLPNSQIPFIGDYVRIVAALCNKYRPQISRSSEEDEQVAAKMLHLSQRANTLQERVEGEGLDRRGMRWSKVDVENVLQIFHAMMKVNCANLRSGYISCAWPSPMLRNILMQTVDLKSSSMTRFLDCCVPKFKADIYPQNSTDAGSALVMEWSMNGFANVKLAQELLGCAAMLPVLSGISLLDDIRIH